MRSAFLLLFAPLAVLAGCSPGPQTADGYVALGEEHRLSGDYEEAIADYTCAIDLQHEAGDPALGTYYLRGASYNRIGKYGLAATDLTRVVSRLTSDAHPGWLILRERAEAYIGLENRADALIDLDRVLRESPGDNYATRLLAKAKNLPLNVEPTSQSHGTQKNLPPASVDKQSFEVDVLKRLDNLVGKRAINTRNPGNTLAFYLHDGSLDPIMAIVSPWATNAGFSDQRLTLEEAHESEAFKHLKKSSPDGMALEVLDIRSHTTSKGDGLDVVSYKATTNSQEVRVLSVGLFHKEGLASE